MDEEKRHPIRVAARRAGVTPHVLRAWESRYGVVVPERSAGGRRLYSDADVDRLRLLQQGVSAGRRIGDLVGFETDELRALVAEDREQVEPRVVPPKGRIPGPSADEYVSRCLAAVRAMDALRFESEIQRAVVSFGAVELVDDVLSRVMQEIGRMWHGGELTPAQEHMATAVVHAVHGYLASRTLPLPGAPGIVVATPARQRHEVGALMAGMVAAADGWRVTYLGADLPADDVAAAVRQVGAAALALSIVHPLDDADLPEELERLRRQLPEGTVLLVGGAGASAYEEALRRIGATVVGDMREFSAQLYHANRVPAGPGSPAHRA